jgi:uncharacterized protein (TIGR01777 family)
MGVKVVITGGSGLIGTRLTALLLEKGYDVAHLGRPHSRAADSRATVPTFAWDPDKAQMDDHALVGCHALIHLAGASIAGRRWTNEYKKEILDSRLNSTRLLFQKIKSTAVSVPTFISASAIGYYGNEDRKRSLVESDKPGNDFLSDVVQRWEKEVMKIADLGIRVCMVRTGIVLSSEAGALSQMARPIGLGMGAPLGTGQQIVSWVHIDDLCRAYIFLLENQLSGPFNVTAPQPVSNRALTEAIAKKLRKPLWLPNIPEFALRIVLGEMAEAVVAGNAVSSAKIVEKGFQFEYDDVDRAIADLL